MPHIDLVLWLASIVEDPSSLTWQGFLILNLGGLLALTFFLGVLANRVANLEKRDEEGRQSLSMNVRTLTEDTQRLRSAYHQMAGYMQMHHSEWKPYNLEK